MGLGDHLRPWAGSALRHIPAGSPFDVLDFRFAGGGADSRWNDPGIPTLYLAGDEGVLIAEWGRHFTRDRTPALQSLTVERSVFRLGLAIDRVLDLRDPAVCAALAIEGAPACFAGIPFARATATFVRRTSAAQALLVPSMAFLDQPEHWRLVLFLDKLPTDPTEYISSVEPCGPLRWG